MRKVMASTVLYMSCYHCHGPMDRQQVAPLLTLFVRLLNLMPNTTVAHE